MLLWKGILVAVFCLSGYRNLGDGGTIGVKFCMMVYIGHRQIFSNLQAVLPGISKYEILAT